MNEKVQGFQDPKNHSGDEDQFPYVDRVRVGNSISWYIMVDNY
jgi:hypothetical protein